MNVPVIAAAGLKGNIGKAHAAFRCQRVQIRHADEVFRVRGVLRALSEDIDLIEFSGIHYFHNFSPL